MKFLGYVENDCETIAVTQQGTDIYFCEEEKFTNPHCLCDPPDITLKIGQKVDFPDEWYFCVSKKSLKKFLTKLK